MSKEVITNSVVDFVLGSERNLETALQVADAMELVRAKLISAALDELRTLLLEKKGEEGWELVGLSAGEPFDYRWAGLTLRREEWPTDKGNFGITIESHEPNLRRMAIGVRAPRNVFGNYAVVSTALKEELNAIKTNDQWPGYEFFLPPYRDWSSPEFLKGARRILEDPSANTFITPIAERMLRLADRIGPLIPSPGEVSQS